MIGLKPVGPPGIVPVQRTAAYEHLGNQMWAGCEHGATESHYGRGRIVCTTQSRVALSSMRVVPDFSYRLSGKDSDGNAGLVFDYVHRRTDGAEIYFVRNTLNQNVAATLSFRVHGRAPELWMTDDGSATPALIYRETKEGHTEIPLTFAAKGSIFILFERPQALHLTGVWKDGSEVFPSAHLGVGVFPGDNFGLIASEPGTYKTMDSSGYSKTFTILPDRSAVPTFGPWTLSFPDGWGAPPSIAINRFQSWTESQNPGVRYFSGTATYRSVLHIPSALITPQRQVWLNLGEVREIASIAVNGVPVQTLWRAPSVVRIDRQLHTGDNKIEIKVTNLWPNRLIGDLQPSATTRYTHTNVRAYTKDSPLLPSGLLEPISLRIESVQQFR